MSSCSAPAAGSARASAILGAAGTGTGRRSTIGEVSEDNALGDYLRARRQLVKPGSVGLAVNGTRRVAGLRREEVALLAGAGRQLLVIFHAQKGTSNATKMALLASMVPAKD